MKTTFFNKLILFPTWFLTRFIILPLTKNHIWKNSKFSLSNWTEHATPLNKFFSISLWGLLVGIIEIITIYYVRK